ncbi:MAG: sugar porter family MFS transporter [Bacteroidales bacterium]|nr:sugar porter family MFS transporter [Bacteroidales bacterium]MCF8390541.1 sugar porter family MFS transporter [Bacteroidales bacterium]
MKTNRLYVVLISLIVALGGFLLGFDSAVISGATPFYKHTFQLDNGSWLIGFSVASIILGAMMGNLVAGKLADIFGRKRILLITALLFTITAIGTAFAPNIIVFIGARIIGGFGVGMAILIAPMYIAEIAPRKMRGTLVTFNQLNIVLGISVAYFTNYFIQSSISDPDLKWRWMLGIGIIPALVYFITLFIVPRSPRWLMQKGFEDEAMKVLTKVQGEEAAKIEFREIKENLQTGKKKESSRFSDVFSRKMKVVLIIGLGIAFFQQITGINAIFYYAPMIFEMAGGGKDAAFLQAIAIGLTNVAMTVVAMFLIDRLGRRPLLLIGAMGISLSLFLVGYSFMNASYTLNEKGISTIISEVTAMDNGEDLALLTTELESLKDISFNSEVEFFSEIKAIVGQESYNSYKEIILKQSISIESIWVLIGLIVYVASFAISLGPVMWALLSEIFPNKLRGLAISIVGFWNSVVSFSVATVFPMELEVLGSSLTFYIYAAFGLMTFLFVLKFIPETKGKSLEEIEATLVGK